MKDQKRKESAAEQHGGAKRPGRANALGLAAGIIAAGLTAGFLLGQEVQTEATPTYCSYEVTGLTPATVAFLQQQGWQAGLSPFLNNTGYVCDPCSTGTVACGASPAYPLGTPNPPVLLVQNSTTCGACTHGGL
jgi:hypothetical protein